MGLMGDKLGVRRVLTQVVLLWSLFTALTGAAWNLVSLLVIRFLFGAGEAGCFPNLTRMLSAWLPLGERVKAQALMWAFGRWGGALAPPVALFVIISLAGAGALWRCRFWVWPGLPYFCPGSATIRPSTKASTPPSWRCWKIHVPWCCTTMACPGIACCCSGTSFSWVCNISASPTPGISTSPGCRPGCSGARAYQAGNGRLRHAAAGAGWHRLHRFGPAAAVHSAPMGCHWRLYRHRHSDPDHPGRA